MSHMSHPVLSSVQAIVEAARGSISAALANKRESVEALEAARLQREHERAEDERHRQRRIAVRTSRANTGLQQIVELAQTPEIQALISVEQERLLHTLSIPDVRAQIVFYEAHRPSGEAWDIRPDHERCGTRDITVTFMHDRIRIRHGSVAAMSLETVDILYAAAPDVRAVVQPHDLLSRGDTVFALKWSQREYEWRPKSLLAQLLVDCSNSARLRGHVERMLKNLTVARQ